MSIEELTSAFVFEGFFDFFQEHFRQWPQTNRSATFLRALSQSGQNCICLWSSLNLILFGLKRRRPLEAFRSTIDASTISDDYFIAKRTKKIVISMTCLLASKRKISHLEISFDLDIPRLTYKSRHVYKKVLLVSSYYLNKKFKKKSRKRRRNILGKENHSLTIWNFLSNDLQFRMTVITLNKN